MLLLFDVSKCFFLWSAPARPTADRSTWRALVDRSMTRPRKHVALKVYSNLGRKYTGYAANLVPPISERFHTYHVGDCLKIDYDAIVHIRAFCG